MLASWLCSGAAVCHTHAPADVCHGVQVVHSMLTKRRLERLKTAPIDIPEVCVCVVLYRIIVVLRTVLL